MNRADRISHQDWQPELGTDDIVGGLDDIGQCIRIILETPLGSDPHRPDFGSNIPRYIDWPQNRVTPYLVRDTRAAIRRWEQRVAVIHVVVTHAMAALELTVEWQPVNGGEPQTTLVRFQRAA